jgi:hypothetical protein
MSTTPWRATGLLFENCSCQLLCPAHVSFKQACTHERCQGHWTIRIDEGHYGDIDLADTAGVIVYDTPQLMYEGGWTQACYIDERATVPQREALDDILSGRAGGPWAVLGHFVETRLETRFVPMRLEDDGREKRLTIPDVLDTTISAIRGADGAAEARLENLYNVIHGPTHILARGRSRCTDRVFDFDNERTHALYSRFIWEAGQGTPTR